MRYLFFCFLLEVTLIANITAAERAHDFILNQEYEIIISIPNMPTKAIVQKWQVSMKSKLEVEVVKAAMLELLDLSNNGFKDGETKKMKWTVFKSNSQSNRIQIETKNANFAQNVKYVFDELEKTKQIPAVEVKTYTEKMAYSNNSNKTKYVIVRTRLSELNLRKEPSDRSAIVCTMQKGSRGIYLKTDTKKDTIEKKEGYWIQVKFHDVATNKDYTGWAWGHFLRLEE
jgi:Bacterial SH3 domain